MSQLFFKGSRESVLLPLKAECLGPQGTVFPVSFKGRFRVIGTEEQKELKTALTEKTMTGEEVIRRLVIGWEGVEDNENQSIEFTPENLEAAMANPFYLDALGEGCLIMLYGKKMMAEVRRKN